MVKNKALKRKVLEIIKYDRKKIFEIPIELLNECEIYNYFYKNIEEENMHKEQLTELQSFNNKLNYVIIKGPSISYWSKGDFLSRSYNDIDILVEKQKILDAHRILKILNYSVNLHEDTFEPNIISDAYHFPEYIKNKFCVELHQKVHSFDYFCTPYIISNAIETLCDNINLRITDVHDTIILLLENISNDLNGYGGITKGLFLNDLIDFENIINNYKSLLSWELIINRAKTYKALHNIYFGLNEVNTFYNNRYSEILSQIKIEIDEKEYINNPDIIVWQITEFDKIFNHEKIYENFELNKIRNMYEINPNLKHPIYIPKDDSLSDKIIIYNLDTLVVSICWNKNIDGVNLFIELTGDFISFFLGYFKIALFDNILGNKYEPDNFYPYNAINICAFLINGDLKYNILDTEGEREFNVRSHVYVPFAQSGDLISNKEFYRFYKIKLPADLNMNTVKTTNAFCCLPEFIEHGQYIREGIKKTFGLPYYYKFQSKKK